jgi:hypothetical protein
MISDEKGKKVALRHTIINVPGKADILDRCRSLGIEKSVQRPYTDEVKEASSIEYTECLND